MDLCRGPHLPNTGLVKEFKVTKNSSAYWLGKKENDSLQRGMLSIYLSIVSISISMFIYLFVYLFILFQCDLFDLFICLCLFCDWLLYRTKPV